MRSKRPGRTKGRRLRPRPSSPGAEAAPTFGWTRACVLFRRLDARRRAGLRPDDVLRFEVTGPCIQVYSGTIDWSMGEDALPLTGVLGDALPPFDGQACVIEVELSLR